MKLSRLLLAALIVAGAGMSWKFVAVTTVAQAQQAQQQQAQNQAPPPASDSSTPVFKAETRLVLVDTIVTDKQGKLPHRPDRQGLQGLGGQQRAADQEFLLRVRLRRSL